MSSLRPVVRNLRRSPAFTITVIATLAIGIGLNAAIFTVVDCVLLRPLGYHDADRIVSLQSRFADKNRTVNRLGGDDYNDIAKQVHGLEATAFYQSGSDGLLLNGTALYLPIAAVSPRFGEVMGVQPVAGRLFRSDDADGHDVLVSAAFAREHFGSAQAAVGQSLELENVARTIVGVLPAGFSFPRQTQVWMETKPTPETPSRSSFSQYAVGKRRAGVTPAQLAAELATFSQQLQRAYPEDAHKTIGFIPLEEEIVGSIRPTLRLLLASVTVILLIVCANITHLQLIRATREQRETTIRAALGAARGTLAARALLQGALLAAAGTLAAILLAVLVLRILIHLAPQDLPRLNDVHLNGDVFAYSFVLALLIMAITALLPVWRAAKTDPAAALRQDAARGTEGRHSIRLRDGLIATEVALTLTLSVVAILLTRQLIAQSHQDLGFSADSLITLDAHAVDTTPLPDQPAASANGPSPRALASYQAARTAIAQQRLQRLDQTLDTITHVPGVASADAILGAPMGFGGPDVGYAVKGRQVFAPPYEGLQNADIHTVTPGIFSTMGVPLLRGRALGADDRLNAPPVLLINQALARAVFAGEDPVGKQIMCGYDSPGEWWTIVGVVGDIRSDSPATPATPTFYVPVAQHPGPARDLQFVVRTTAPPAEVAATLQKSLRITHPGIAVKATTMRENIGETERADTFRLLLFAGFAAVSILLAAVGMYGVTAYSVAQRRFEFGLRFALGANRAQMLGLVLRKAFRTTLAGVLIGLALAVTASKLLASLLGKLPAFDIAAYLAAAAGVLLIALCAALIPARRAASIDPMQALRSE